MRAAAPAFVALALLASAFGLSLARASRPPAAPLSCSPVVVVVESAGERLACTDDAALAGCEAIAPGRRYRGCEDLGPARGAVLRLRGQAISINEASAEDLRALPRVGRKLARALVEGRRDRPYCGPADLERAKGVGARRAGELGGALAFAHPLCDGPAAQ